jgi:hypothetical protein
MAVMTEIEVKPQVHPARLVVLVPEQVENLADLAHHVYVQALAQQRCVVFLALSRHADDQMYAARTLATLAALTQGSLVQAETSLVSAEHWADALRQATLPGDLVLCLDEQMLAAGATRSFSALEEELGIAVRSLPDAAGWGAAQANSWIRTAISWLTAVAILVGFSFLEIHLAGLISGGIKKVVLVALVALELGIFYQWDKFFS